MKRLNFLLFAVISTLLFSCGSYSEGELSEFDQEIEKYMKSNKIDCEKSGSGLYYKIIEEGEGDFIQFTDKVLVKYRGTLLGGKKIDEQTEPIEMAVSAQINAWKELMLQLKKGSKAYMIVPPHLGYGEYTVDKIPPNSILVFELEIVDVL